MRINYSDEILVNDEYPHQSAFLMGDHIVNLSSIKDGQLLGAYLKSVTYGCQKSCWLSKATSKVGTIGEYGHPRNLVGGFLVVAPWSWRGGHYPASRLAIHRSWSGFPIPIGCC